MPGVRQTYEEFNVQVVFTGEDETAYDYIERLSLIHIYWMHNGFVNIDNVKMSKSLGNFITVHDALKTIIGLSPLTY